MLGLFDRTMSIFSKSRCCGPSFSAKASAVHAQVWRAVSILGKVHSIGNASQCFNLEFPKSLTRFPQILPHGDLRHGVRCMKLVNVSLIPMVAPAAPLTAVVNCVPIDECRVRGGPGPSRTRCLSQEARPNVTSDLRQLALPSIVALLIGLDSYRAPGIDVSS